ncbi:MAG: hypothetical protein ACAH89_11015 [Rariglobus sp.]|nr:hypothetical protein [Rariglobus sp.]
MRVTPLLILAVSTVLPLGLRAEDPARVDPAQRNTQLAPTPESADTPLSPGREANQRPFFRNEVVQDQRFNAPDKIDRKDAPVGERRAPISVTETREKNMIERKDFPKPEVREREMNRHDGEKSRIQPKGDMIKSYDKVTKYQDGMAEANTGAFQRQPKLEKRMSFEKLNRFIFRRNGPGSENGSAMVTPAAGGPAPAPQDTYTKYQVDWKRLDAPK